jgi:hypothetical protein
MFAINAILMILFHLAPTADGMAWSIYQNNGVYLVVPQGSKGTAMKPKIVIHNHYSKPAQDAHPDQIAFDYAKAEGETARKAGRPRSSCPYPIGSNKRKYWEKGYDAGSR